jgi:hypothetical protein
MDDWTCSVDEHPGYATWAPRLFVSEIGSNHWDTVIPPTKAHIKTLYADSEGIYVGMYGSAEVFKYIPSEKTWQQFKLKDSLNAGEWYTVYGIGRFQGRLIVSVAGYRDSVSDANVDITAFVKWKSYSGWGNVNVDPRLHYQTGSLSDSATVPFQFHKGIEWNGKFYAITMDNVWSLDAGGTAWTKLPNVPKLISRFASYWRKPIIDIVLHKEKLYIVDGIDNAIFEFDEISEAWQEVDSLYFQGDTTDSDYLIYHNASDISAKSLVSSGKHLFAAGEGNGIPYVYMGDYGEPYGNIPKGCRKVGSWCKNFNCLEGGGTTYSMDVIGDTLYVANWKNLLKFPLDKLDSAIANEKDY